MDSTTLDQLEGYLAEFRRHFVGDTHESMEVDRTSEGSNARPRGGDVLADSEEGGLERSSLDREEEQVEEGGGERQIVVDMDEDDLATDGILVDIYQNMAEIERILMSPDTHDSMQVDRTSEGSRTDGGGCAAELGDSDLDREASAVDEAVAEGRRIIRETIQHDPRSSATPEPASRYSVEEGVVSESSEAMGFLMDVEEAPTWVVKRE